jgi:hypothetical protein
MATMTELLGAQAAQQNTQGALAGVGDSVSAGIKTGMQLAQTQQDVEVKKQQTQLLQDEVHKKKLSGVANLSKAYMFANDAQAESVKKALKTYGEQANVPIDLDALDAIRKDPATRLAAQKKLGDLTSGKAPDDPAGTLGMFANSQALFSEVNSAVSENSKIQNKYDQQLALKDAQLEAMKAAIAGRQTNQQERSDNQVNRQFTDVMKKSQDGLHQATRAENLISKISSGDLKANKAIRADLSGTLASLVNNGTPATVHGSTQQEFDSAFGRVGDAYNFLSGSAETTLPPEQLKQLKIDISALKHEYSLQNDDTYRSFREGINPRQQEKLDKRFNTFRKQKGLDESSFGEEPPASNSSPPPATGTPPPTTLPKFDAVGFVKNARAAKKDDTTIAGFLKNKGIPDADIQAAMGAK